jgi:hypothetical protein
MQASGNGDKQATGRLVRSHAVKQALQKKRRVEQLSSNNFRVTTLNEKPKGMGCDDAQHEIPPSSPFSLSAGALDPFQALAVDSSRLQTFLGNCKILQPLGTGFRGAHHK